MESTNGQRCLDGHTQGRPTSTNLVVGDTAVLPPSLEAPISDNIQMSSCNMGEEDNSDPATVRPPEKFGQSARHIEMSHPATKTGDTDGERQRITMLKVTAAISVSLVISLSANLCLTCLSG